AEKFDSFPSALLRGVAAPPWTPPERDVDHGGDAAVGAPRFDPDRPMQLALDQATDDLQAQPRLRKGEARGPALPVVLDHEAPGLRLPAHPRDGAPPPAP